MLELCKDWDSQVYAPEPHLHKYMLTFNWDKESEATQRHSLTTILYLMSEEDNQKH